MGPDHKKKTQGIAHKKDDGNSDIQVVLVTDGLICHQNMIAARHQHTDHSDHHHARLHSCCTGIKLLRMIAQAPEEKG